jgi:hypothetical protein
MTSAWSRAVEALRPPPQVPLSQWLEKTLWVNTVTPKKGRPISLGNDWTPTSAFARVPGGKYRHKQATSSARRGALPMCDVTACPKYHITCITL